jgi:hypothetical protein
VSFVALVVAFGTLVQLNYLSKLPINLSLLPVTMFLGRIPTTHNSVPSRTLTMATASSTLPLISATDVLKRIRSSSCRYLPKQLWETHDLPLLHSFIPTIFIQNFELSRRKNWNNSKLSFSEKKVLGVQDHRHVQDPGKYGNYGRLFVF